MKTKLFCAVGAVATVLLVGCSPVSPQESTPKVETTPVSTPAPTPTIDPGPVELSNEDAAARYLGLVCQRNANNASLHNAFVAGEETYFNGGQPDPAAVKSAAAEGLRIHRLAVELIDDEYYTWPADVAPHIQTIRTAYMALMSYYDMVANASSYASAYNAVAPDPPGAAAAAQEVRYQLGLPADTTASCQGHETATDTLHAEMLERNEYLGTFD